MPLSSILVAEMISKRLLPLVLGGLSIGTTEFVIMGLLPDIANSLQVSIPEAGYLISSYALGVVIGAPILVAFSSKYPPKKTLISLMILFTLFNGLSAIAPEYYSLLSFRFLSGLPHGAFFGVGAVVATKLAEEGKQAQSIAAMFLGLTVANLAMVPLVNYIGQVFSWRLAFGIVAILGLLTILFLILWLPHLKNLRNVGLRQELEFFKTIKAWHIISIAGIGFGGLFSWFSYIAPLLTEVSIFSSENISYLMVLAGAGMVIGNYLGGILADKLNPIKATALLLLLMVITLLLVFLISENKIASLILTFICGALSMAAGSPLNILMLRAAKNSEMMAAAFMQAAFNIANSLGAFLGGIPLSIGLTYNYPSLVGVALAGLGLILSLFYAKIHKTK